MGIKGLFHQFKHNAKKHQDFVFKPKTLIDFSNIIYQEFLTARNAQITPRIKLDILMSFCRKIARHPENEYYIVFDPMSNSTKKIEIDLSEINKTLYGFTLKYIDDDGRTLELYAPDGRKVSSYSIHKGNRKIRMRQVNKTQTQSNILKVPLYNFMIIRKYFANAENVHILHSAFNADEVIKTLCKQFLCDGVSPKDITILSKDSDMLLDGVSVQNKDLFFSPVSVCNKDRIYMAGCDVCETIVPLKDLQKMTPEELETRRRREIVQRHNLALLFAEIQYNYYDKIHLIGPEIPSFEEYNFQDIVMTYLVYHQGVLHSQLQTLLELKRDYKHFVRCENEQFVRYFNRALHNEEFKVLMYEEERSVLKHYENMIQNV